MDWLADAVEVRTDITGSGYEFGAGVRDKQVAARTLSVNWCCGR
jgi:hypothetical protein